MLGGKIVRLGAPEIDPKRPYGNSYVPGDIAEILVWEIEEDGLTDEQEELANALHKEQGNKNGSADYTDLPVEFKKTSH